MSGLFNYPKRDLRKLINQGEFEKAIELGNELEAKLSQDPDFLFIMGSMFYMLNDEKNTLHYIDRVLEIKPDDIESLSLKLRVHQYLKENDIVITQSYTFVATTNSIINCGATPWLFDISKENFNIKGFVKNAKINLLNLHITKRI